jgi:tetratricopeptide (TPR) repeat protein
MKLIDNGILNPIFYNDEANYLARNERFEEAMEIIRKAEENKCVNEFILSVKATILEKSGHEADASALRRLQIEKGVRNPVFFADEANYLARNKRFKEAMEIIKKVEALGIANKYTRSIKEKIERGLEGE